MVKGTEKQTMIYKPQHRGDDYVCFVLDQNAEPIFSSRSRNKPGFVFTCHGKPAANAIYISF